MKRMSGLLWVMALSISSGGLFAASTAAMVKLTQYDRAEYGDLAVAGDGRLHAVFTDAPAIGKPYYLYYRSSTDGGKAWSESYNLSDDESGNSASYCRVLFDGKGRLYAIWKYIANGELLDGPGGHANGRLVYRCQTDGQWSKRILLGDDKIPTYSWFATVDSSGAVQVIWSQANKDTMDTVGSSVSDYANLVRQAALDGGIPVVRDLIVPAPLLTKQQQDQMKAAGKYPKYEETRPRPTGLINLRGFVDAQGTAHFAAENPGIRDGPSNQQTGRQIIVWDGAKLNPVYAYEKYKSFNNFNNPPALLQDAAGKQHLIRAPEKSEKPCVRDYPVDGAELGDFANIVEPKSGPGLIRNWQAYQLPGGRMAVSVALSEKGGYDPDDTEVCVSFSDGGGKWSPPLTIRNSRAKKEGFSKETGGGNAVAAVYSYRPKFAAMASGKDGKAVMLLVDSEDNLIGLTSPARTSSGSIVSATGSVRVEKPAVFFLKL